MVTITATVAVTAPPVRGRRVTQAVEPAPAPPPDDDAAPTPPARQGLAWSPRVGLAKQKAGAREIAKAATGRRERPAGSKTLRPLLKVSHKRPKR